MHSRFYGLVGLLVLLCHPPALADLERPHFFSPFARPMTGGADVGLQLPITDLLRVAEQSRQARESRSAGYPDPSFSVTAHPVVLRSRSPLSFLSPPVQELLRPWLPTRAHRDSVSAAAAKTNESLMPPVWQATQKTPLPRLDHVWNLAPGNRLAQRYGGWLIESDTDVSLEVRAGGTKKDWATNMIKGTTTTQLRLLPALGLLQRFGRYLTLLSADTARRNSSPGQLHMVLATNGTYALHPGSKTFKPTGEVVGTLSWAPIPHERLVSDPWRVVAFRLDPSIQWEGRSTVSTEQNNVSLGMPVATVTGKLRGDVRLDFLSPRLTASGDYHYGQRLTDTRATWQQATVSWTYRLNTHVSVGGSFKHGTLAANHAPQRELKLEMGVTF